jgi:hypothetical protein
MPLTFTGPAPVVVDDGVGVAALGETIEDVTEPKLLTLELAEPIADELGAAEDDTDSELITAELGAAEGVADPELNTAELEAAEGVADPELITAELVEPTEVELEVADTIDEALAGALSPPIEVDEDCADEEVVVAAELSPDGSSEIAQVLISRNAGCPLASVMGVRTIVQTCFTGPADIV